MMNLDISADRSKITKTWKNAVLTKVSFYYLLSKAQHTWDVSAFYSKPMLVWLANWYWQAAAKLSSTSTSVTTPPTFEEIVLIKLLCITKWKSNFRYFGSEWFESKWFLGSLVNQINQMRAGLLLYKCGQERAEREINYDGSLGKRIFYTLRMKLPNGLKYIFQMFTWYPFIKKCKIFFVFHALALKYDRSFRCLRLLHCARSLCLALTTDVRLPLR